MVFEPKIKRPQLILIPTVLLSLWTYQRNTVWTSEVSLWEEAINHPDVGEAWYGLEILFACNRHEEAERVSDQYSKIQSIGMLQQSWIGSYSNE